MDDVYRPYSSIFTVNFQQIFTHWAAVELSERFLSKFNQVCVCKKGLCECDNI